MKAHLLLIFFIITANSYSQSVSIKNLKSGELALNLITIGYNPKEITELSINGPIDANDIAYINNNMPRLKNIDLYDGTISDHAIPEKAFWNNNHIERIVLPKELLHINNQAFELCVSLEEVIFNTEITNIGYNVFMNCISLKSIDLSKCSELNNIGLWMFVGCENLTSVKFPSSIETIYSSGFSNCTSLEKIDLSHSNLKEIQDWTFYKCVSLKEVLLPKSIKKLGLISFEDCSNLQNFTVMSPIPPILDEDVFLNVPQSSCKLIVPTGSKIKYQTAAQWGMFDNIVEMNFDPSTNTELIQQENIKTANGTLLIENINKVANVSLCNLNGSIVYSKNNITNQITINNLKPGIYILLINNKATKISIL